jgi:uncharacterized alpha-E superfamily protein
MGRLLERADKTSRILDVKYFTLLPTVDSVGTAHDDLQWSSLLFSISGFEAYRRTHHMIRSDSVVDFFLLHHEFPRSVLFCIENIETSLTAITGGASDPRHAGAAKLVAGVKEKLRTTEASQILRDGLHEFVDSLQQDMNEIGEAIKNTYFL